jgi:hypothetical protein
MEDAYAVDGLFAGYQYAVLAGWLCLAASLYFAFRRPAANALLNLTLVGMGGARLVHGYTWGRLSAGVAVLTVLALVLQKKQEGAVRLRDLARSPLAWFAAVCMVISAKILLETMIYGLDTSRRMYLSSAVVEGLFPVVVLLLAECRQSPEATERDLLLGMVTFPVLVIAGYLPFALKNGLISSAMDGSTRFSLGGADTINSARVLAYGGIASLVFFSSPRNRGVALRWLAPFLTAGFGVLLLLTGTRQFLLAFSVFLLLWAFLLQSSNWWRWLGGVATVACVAVTVSRFVGSSEIALKERVGSSELKWDASEGRGTIWAEAFQSVLKHPMLGTGFKNFGEKFDMVDKTGRPYVNRDTAHGVLQDVFAEHGVPLGIAFLAGCFHLVGRSWRAIRRAGKPTNANALRVGLFSLLLPLLFSGIFLNALAIYLLLITAMARDSQQDGERQGREGIRNPAQVRSGGRYSGSSCGRGRACQRHQDPGQGT